GGENWRRVGNELHGDYPVRAGADVARAHVEVELRPIDALFERGTLIVLLDLLLVGALWLLAVLADGGVSRWLRVRRRSWRRSYRARLTLALFTFFVVPAGAFATWSYRQLAVDARRSRELLVRETLRAVDPYDDGGDWLDRESRRLGSPLLHYDRGQLVAASDALYEALAPLGRLLPREVQRDLVLEGEVTTSRVERVAGRPTLFGFRAVEQPRQGSVLATPARVGQLDLERRRRDLAVLVLFATAAGGLAAFWLSGVAARQLAQPISALRGAALAIAEGEREPTLAAEPTAEFRPVFAAFRRMAHDLAESRSALEAAQRRTSAVLRNVASGVIAVTEDGRVTLANPRAEALLETALAPGAPLREATARRAPALAPIVARFLEGSRDDEEFDLLLDDQQLRGRLTRLTQGGTVVTLDDVTALARAQRVLAWGEMARQVAHEIKNPLTPIRLGVQHLRRAYATRRDEFESILDKNVGRILGEIDRLDEIARSFSRYGMAPAEREPAEPTDVAQVVRDVVALESMGESGVDWRLRGAEEPALALARAGELRDVLVNVLENARLANARVVSASVARDDGVVRVLVEDDGDGIPAEVLPRIFEPHFSTRTSGSGLGLAISRRLLDGWGGRIAVESERGKGTVVTVELKAVGGGA
ncbi:MAG TPA: ATP-binding protein, partial [Gemmatimonadaceae bacterium]|nr:ATP-binding protein [Gemmatimonadaceae bacterium]